MPKLVGGNQLLTEGSTRLFILAVYVCLKDHFADGKAEVLMFRLSWLMVIVLVTTGVPVVSQEGETEGEGEVLVDPISEEELIELTESYSAYSEENDAEEDEVLQTDLDDLFQWSEEFFEALRPILIEEEVDTEGLSAAFEGYREQIELLEEGEEAPAFDYPPLNDAIERSPSLFEVAALDVELIREDLVLRLGLDPVLPPEDKNPLGAGSATTAAPIPPQSELPAIVSAKFTAPYPYTRYVDGGRITNTASANYNWWSSSSALLAGYDHDSITLGAPFRAISGVSEIDVEADASGYWSTATAGFLAVGVARAYVELKVFDGSTLVANHYISLSTSAMAVMGKWSDKGGGDLKLKCRISAPTPGRSYLAVLEVHTKTFVSGGASSHALTGGSLKEIRVEQRR